MANGTGHRFAPKIQSTIHVLIIYRLNRNRIVTTRLFVNCDRRLILVDISCKSDSRKLDGEKVLLSTFATIYLIWAGRLTRESTNMGLMLPEIAVSQDDADSLSPY
jgi:hypothetical protein